MTTVFPTDVRPLLTGLADVGVALFMFLIGLELDRGLVRGHGSLMASVSAGSLVVPFGLGALVAPVLAGVLVSGALTEWMGLHLRILQPSAPVRDETAEPFLPTALKSGPPHRR